MMRRRRALAELDRDIRDHIERETQENLESGMAPDEARRQALLAFGNVALVREDTRAVWARRWLDDLRQDLRYAVRMLRASPGFATAVVVTLALSIGTNTAIFSLVETVLLRSLPVERPEELLFLQGTGDDRGAPPYPIFERFRGSASSFTGMAAFATDELRVEVHGQVEQVFGQVASGTYFEVLGVEPVAGRLMTLDDERLDPPVAVIGYGYWQRRFGGAPDAIGRTVSFRNRIFTIVGVTPREFRGLQPGRHVDVTLPITLERDLLANLDARWFTAVARLRPGISVRQASVEANAISEALFDDVGRSTQRRDTQRAGLQLAPASRGLDGLRRAVGMPLLALAVLAAIVLLVACANLALLLTVRGAARSREFAVRLATGAARGRLLRQVLTETCVLFALGACAALVVGYILAQALTGLFATGRRPILLDVQFTWTLLSYAVAITFSSGLVTGLWPASRAWRTDLHAAMKQTGARVVRLSRLATTRALVGAQVATSLALLVTALLFVKTIANLRATDLGFSGADVLTMSVQPELPRDAAAHEQFWTEVLDRVRDLPSVRDASLSVLTPLSGRNTGTAFGVPGLPPIGDIRMNRVSAAYPRVFGIELVAGRAFDRNDTGNAAKTVVLNETAARAAFGTRSALGERVDLGGLGVYQIVGIVRDHKHLTVREQPTPYAFIPLWPSPDEMSRLTLAVVSDQPRTTLARAVSNVVGTIHPNTLVSDVITVEDQIDATLVNERLVAMLASGFAALVLALAAVGVYGVVSYSVAGRRTEFAVRLALGAPRSHVASGVVREALLHVAAGIGVGLPLALVMGRLAERFLFGVAPTDGASYALGAGTLIVVACAAAWLPGRRACAVDPAETLRCG